MTRRDQHLPPERLEAVEHLIAASALCEHPTFLDCWNPNTKALDIEGLQDWRWSGGELTLIDTLLVICGYPRDVQLLDLWKLDESNRRAVVTALDIAMNGATLATVTVHPALKAVK